MDDRATTPVTVELNDTAAELLGEAHASISRPTSHTGVLSRALGLLEQAMGAKARGQRLGVYDPRVGTVHGPGDLSMSLQDRSRPRPLPPDRPRQDQAEPAQVHLAGRDDRAEGQGHGLDPAAADRHPALQLRRQGAGRRRAGRGRGRRRARPGRSATPTARARRAISPGDHLLEVELSLQELAEIMGEELELPRIEPKGNREDRRAEGQVLGHPHAPAPSRCATSGARSARRCAARSRRARTTRRTRSSSRSARTSATARGAASRCRSRTPSSST